MRDGLRAVYSLSCNLCVDYDRPHTLDGIQHTYLELELSWQVRPGGADAGLVSRLIICYIASKSLWLVCVTLR